MADQPTRVAVGLDVGGTKIAAGLVDAHGVVRAFERYPTPKDPDALGPALEAAARAVTGDGDGRPLTMPVGCGFPSLVTRDGVARYGPNISVAEYPLRAVLRERLGTDAVVVDNDATAATWAEWAVGAGRDAGSDMMMVTLGTGVGGGMIVDGRLVRGANGFAGDLGHLIIVVDGEAGPSGVRGESEAYCSGAAQGRMAREAFEAGAFIGTPLEMDRAPTAAEVAVAALDGVAPAVEIHHTVGRYLGITCASLVNAFDTELIVIGGGAASSGELIFAPARKAMREHLLGPDHRPEVPIVPAALGPDAGVVGAALLALEAFGA